MRYFLLFTFSLFLCFPTFAQNAVNTTKPEARTEIEELLGTAKPKKEPQSIQDFANLHYLNCTQTQHPILAGEDLERACACTKDKFRENMDLNQIREMQNNTKEGQYQQSRMLLFVYAPCIKFPLQMMLSIQCMNNTKNKYLMKNQPNTCGCIATRVSKAATDLIPQYIETAIKLRIDLSRPFDILVRPVHIDSYLSSHTSQCLREFEDIY